MSQKIKIFSTEGKTLYTSDKAKSLKEAVGEAVRARIDLSGADFENADLSFIDLTGANLFSANLTNANLRGTKFEGANLTACDMHGAEAFSADFSGAKLKGSNMEETNLGKTSFRLADLSDTTLVRANLKGSSLDGAIFTSADMHNVMLDGAKGRNVEFGSAIMESVHMDTETALEKSNFEGALLENAIMDGAVLRDASFNNAVMENVVLRNADLSRSKFVETKINGANFSQSNLDHCAFQNIKAENVNFNKATANETTWDGCTFQNTNFSEGKFWKSQFKDMLITESNMNHANLIDAFFVSSALILCTLVKANIERSRIINSQLEGSQFIDCSAKGASMQDVNLQDAVFKGTVIEGAGTFEEQVDRSSLFQVKTDAEHMCDLEETFLKNLLGALTDVNGYKPITESHLMPQTIEGYVFGGNDAINLTLDTMAHGYGTTVYLTKEQMDRLGLQATNESVPIFKENSRGEIVCVPVYNLDATDFRGKFPQTHADLTRTLKNTLLNKNSINPAPNEQKFLDEIDKLVEPASVNAPINKPIEHLLSIVFANQAVPGAINDIYSRADLEQLKKAVQDRLNFIKDNRLAVQDDYDVNKLNHYAIAGLLSAGKKSEKRLTTHKLDIGAVNTPKLINDSERRQAQARDQAQKAEASKSSGRGK